MTHFRNGSLADDRSGVAVLEFALILPVFLLLLFGVIEFGWYFIRYEAVNRALSLTSVSAAGGGNTVTQAMANSFAAGIIPFGDGSSYICVQAYSTSAAASAANPPCTKGSWALGKGGTPPTCVDTGSQCPSSYYVGILAYAEPASLTGLVNDILPGGTSITLQTPVTPVNPTNAGIISATGWVTIDTPFAILGVSDSNNDCYNETGFVFSHNPSPGNSGYSACGAAYEDGKNHSPNTMCANAGYTNATGACTVTVSGSTILGTTAFLGQSMPGGPIISCAAGNIVAANTGMQILCAK